MYAVPFSFPHHFPYHYPYPYPLLWFCQNHYPYYPWFTSGRNLDAHHFCGSVRTLPTQ